MISRRLLLRIAVALLAFLIGITAVVVFGKFNSRSWGGERHYRSRRCYRNALVTPPTPPSPLTPPQRTAYAER